eukprot:62958-Chlamydomonas_euryale.AAC.8
MGALTEVSAGCAPGASGRHEPCTHTAGSSLDGCGSSSECWGLAARTCLPTSFQSKQADSGVRMQ